MPSRTRVPRHALWAAAGIVALPAAAEQPQPAPQPAPPTIAVRVATYNVEDVRTEDLRRTTNPRLRALAQTIQRIRPNIILLNEIAYDLPGAPGFLPGQEPGQNARRFAEDFLAVPQVEGLAPVRYRAFMAPSNTGMPSGHDLNNDGRIVLSFPTPPPAAPDGTPGPQTDEGRAYGNDCWGFGTFPGQYAMGLLVDERLEILTDQVRTFRLLPWDYMPNHLMPADPDTGGPWYPEPVREVMRLSSKSHWDIPVRLPDGTILHILCSHPTPPAFDGPEQRNVRRNHDEVRFWADYVEDASYIIDDQGRPGGLPSGSLFVILGDLNLDPADSHEIGNAMRDILLASPRVNPAFTPTSDITPQSASLRPTDTALWGKRADYAIPSARIQVVRGGIWRHLPTGHDRYPSDHFPVWVDLAVPQRQEQRP